MPHEKVNNKYKDTLFRIIFGDYKENALSLYNAINGTEYTDVDALEITTLKDALYISIKNDVSFLFNNDMNLYEHQSSYCPNMPLRDLGYFADLYQILLGGGDIAHERIYSSIRVSIPAPKYYVFYNGTEQRPDSEELKLSTMYEGEGDIEVTAHMINSNTGHNMNLMDRCKPLAEYAEFVGRLRGELKRCETKEGAIGRAIESCIEDGVLVEILRKERARIMNALIRGLTDEQIENLRKWEVEEGIKKGRAEASLEAVDKFVADGLCDAAKACEILGVDLDAYYRYLEEKEH